jgi:transcriptional regulator with GAF, ATPase, and Fis domain
MKKILIAWIGKTDLRAPLESDFIGLGPIAQALLWQPFDALELLCDSQGAELNAYLAWLQSLTPTPANLCPVQISSPTSYGDIYQAALQAVRSIRAEQPTAEFTYHLSPGTPAMAAVWVLLAKTIHPAALIQSSREHGVLVADIPFDISAEYLPTLRAEDSRRLEEMLASLPPQAPEFDNIIHRSPQMQRLIARARLAAQHEVPVLIEGESGTGKELLARAIHSSSLRREQSFIAVNCGAIPAELLESEFFGHKKGSFTGAVVDRKGYFESAHGGTLFLDEIGELPLAAQVKILRVLQEGELMRVGDTIPVKVDVRIVAATNRTLIKEVAAGRFRADLFYRLAVAVLFIPPLRERQGDIGLLIEHVLHSDVRLQKKIFSGAKNLLLAHPWPGNVRELINTLRRATVWAEGDTIQADDIREALFSVELQPEEHILHRGLTEDFKLPEVIADVARHYLARAMSEAGGNKSKAAQILGLPNYQTLSNWLKKYGLE